MAIIHKWCKRHEHVNDSNQEFKDFKTFFVWLIASVILAKITGFLSILCEVTKSSKYSSCDLRFSLYLSIALKCFESVELVKLVKKPFVIKKKSKVGACKLPTENNTPDGMIALHEILKELKIEPKLVESNFHDAFVKFIQMNNPDFNSTDGNFATIVSGKTNYNELDKLSLKIASGFARG